MINRILIVGLGSIGKRHLRLARFRFPNAEIKILRHEATIKVPKYSNGIFSNIQEAISFNPQLAIIANPATYHIPVAQALAETGVHLLIEKPISSSLIGIKQLLKTVKEKELVLLIGYNLRYLKSLRFFKKQIDLGIVGKCLSVRCEMGAYLPDWRPECDYTRGVSAKKNLGGGALLELSHELDFLSWIFGDIKWVKANLSKQSNLTIDVEDTVHIIMGFLPSPCGHQLVGSLNLDFIRHDPTRICTVIGDKGSLLWNGISNQVMFFEAGSSVWIELKKFDIKRDDSYILEWEDLTSSILNKDIPQVTGHDGLKVMQIIKYVRQSSKSGKKEYVLET